MSDLQAGPDLDAAIGKLMGLDVLGVSGCSREPECGEWEPTDHWAESGHEGAPRPVYVRYCCCEFADDDDARIFGHIQFCLQVVPAYSTDISAAQLVLAAWEDDVGLRRQNGSWRVELFKPSMQWSVWAETAPLAICLAALAALEAT